MYRKNNYNTFIKNNNGQIIIEFILVVSIIALLIKLLISITQYQSTVGKLDRISYSIAGIVRERERLYDNSTLLTQNNVNELARLANHMLSGSGVSTRDLAITIETLHFNPVSSAASGDKTIDNAHSLELSVGTCHPARSLREMANLSPYSNRGRWMPLYQVTLCLPAPEWYRLGGTIPTMTSSAITIERSSVRNTD